MKKLISLFILCIALIVGCAKDDELMENQDEMMLKKASKAPVFVVTPNGTDDTQSIINAFTEAMAAGPGAVVQLVEGEYFIRFIEIHEFCGKFKGAGKSKTVITALNDLDFEPLVSKHLNTYLIKFVGGDVELCNMTIRTPEGPLNSSTVWWLEGLVSFSAQNRVYASEKDYIKAVVDNVDFVASAAPGKWKSNCNTGISIGFDSRYKKLSDGWPLSPTDIKITNCLFDNFDIYGAIFAYLSEGKIIAGTKSNGNIFKNNSTAGYKYGGSLSFWHNVNVEVSIVDNTIDVPSYGWFGIEVNTSPWLAWLQDVLQTKTSVFNIDKNILSIAGGIGGMLIKDNIRLVDSEAIPTLFNVKNNRFNMSEGTFTGLGCFNNFGMVIRNNKFAGDAAYGVRVFGFYNENPNFPVFLYNENGLMLGNNFSNANFSETVLWLGEWTKDWTIVGSNLGESVWNDGENNVISGFNTNTSEVPFGQTIVDNLWEMKRATHDLKGK